MSAPLKRALIAVVIGIPFVGHSGAFAREHVGRWSVSFLCVRLKAGIADWAGVPIVGL